MPTNRYSCLRRCTTLLTLALSGTLAASMAHAQEGTSETVPAKPAEPAEVTCIVGGDVWTVTHGVVKKGVVVMRGAKIEKVGGPETAIPAGATVVHADGKVVAPGFVADGAQLGGSVFTLGLSGSGVWRYLRVSFGHRGWWATPGRRRRWPIWRRACGGW